MTGSWDVAQALRGGIRDRRQAWDVVRDFAAAWSAPLDDDSGTPGRELERAEAALGLRFPVALREGYSLLGATRHDLTGNQDPLLPPSKLFVHDELGGVLVFRSENQGCAIWGVRLRDLRQDDPPVLVQSLDGWIPFLERVSLAWVELVLSETLLRGDPLYNACELPAQLSRGLPGLYTHVDLPDYPMWTGAEESPVRWFSAPGKLLRLDGQGDHSWLHVRGRTAADLESIYATVPGQWTCDYSPLPEAGELPF
ncbi:SMI1/KNR4 family protein [Streptomyces roseicoloratus]|uniref:SMI1/KNR4 family protein n=1 Tax=Streptomyces roseicoloratus TaxID=2508722 RepID=A0ABY9S1D0_9ACTN|nr:SMI1/KNR4 family protein [Streptomyces roseicoloratus]WMX48032.1 SMI1/KNR4 family protein [Streptomyces roseicoloratus]